VSAEIERLLANQSPRARQALVRAGARIDHAARGTREALESALRARGLPLLAGVLDAEAELGGLRSAIVAVLPMRSAPGAPVGRTEDGAPALFVAGMRSPFKELFVDDRGRVHGRELYGDPLVHLADSLRAIIEKIVLFKGVEPRRSRAWRLRFGPRVGASLAAALGAEPVLEASDGVHTFWELPGILIADGGALFSGREETRVWTWEARDVARVMRAGSAERVTLDLARGDAPCEVQFHPPGVPPQAPEAGCVRFASADGWVSVDEASILTQVRVREGNVERWTTLDEWGACIRVYAPDFEALLPHLSRAALESLVRADAWRDRALTCSRAELCALLDHHGLRAPEALFEMEEAAGGLCVTGARAFGPYAILHAMRGRATCAPIAVGYVMDQDGHIRFEDEDIDVSALVADSWRVHLEHWARHVDPRHHSRSLLRVDRVVGTELARALGASLAPSASDSAASVWESPHSVVVEQRVPIPFYSPPLTELTSDDGDAVVAAMQRIHARDPEARMWARLGSFTAGAPLVVDVPRWDGWEQRSRARLRVYGTPGAYFTEQA